MSTSETTTAGRLSAQHLTRLVKVQGKPGELIGLLVGVQHGAGLQTVLAIRYDTDTDLQLQVNQESAVELLT